MTAKLQRRPPRDRRELDALCEVAFASMSAGVGIVPACKSATINSNVLYLWMERKGLTTPRFADRRRVIANKSKLEARLIEAHFHMKSGMLIKPACALAGTTTKAMRTWMAQAGLFTPGASAVERDRRCADALQSFLSGVDQVKACSDAGVSVGCFRRWRAARGIKPTHSQLAEMRSSRHTFSKERQQ